MCVTRRTVNYIRKIRHETLTLNLCVKDSDSSQNDDTGTMTNTHLLGLWKHFSCFVWIPWDAGVVCGHPPVVFFCSQSQPPSFSSPKKRQNIKLLKDIKLLTWQNQITFVQISVNKTDLVLEIVKILYYMSNNHVVSVSISFISNFISFIYYNFVVLLSFLWFLKKYVYIGFIHFISVNFNCISSNKIVFNGFSY